MENFIKEQKYKKAFILKGKDRYTQRDTHCFDDQKILDLFEEIDDINLYPIINNTRVIKSEEEIQLMKEIMSISS